MSRKTRIRLGMPGRFKEAEVSLPDREPDPWDIEADLRVVGRRIPRVDGPDKVSGRARYTFDLQIPGMLHGAILRCPLPHARLKRIDTALAETHPGVRAVLVLEAKEYPYAGCEVAAVAADTLAAAEEALRRIKVEYEPLPFVTDPDRARQPGAPAVRPSGNVEPTVSTRRGDVEAAWRSSDAVVEAVFRTPVALHACLEGHGSLAKWDGDQVTLWDSTQAVFDVRDSLAKALGIPADKVRVIKDHAGGGFGSKLQMRSYSPIAARLARKAGAPVRLLLNRRDDFLATGNRHSSVQTVKIAGKKDGTLTALSWKSYGTGGTEGGAQTSGPIPDLYRFPSLRIEEEDVFTHAGPACPMRAPGHVQGMIGLEGAIDELSEKLGLDPLEVRIKNDPSDLRREEFKLGAARFGWKSRRPSGTSPGPRKRGMGVAGSTWDGSGIPGPRVEIKLHARGGVDLYCGTQDIGTGTRTLLAQVAAEELGLRVDDVSVHLGDSYFPYSILSGGSLTAASVTPAARSAAADARRALLDRAAAVLGVRAEDLKTSRRRVAAPGGKVIAWEEVLRQVPGGTLAGVGERAPNFSGYHRGTAGCQFVEAEVDVETGQVRVLRVVAVHDSGRVVNPLLWESQVNGGILQGISFALLEERVMDHRFGKVLNPNLEAYKVIGALEVPEIEIHPFPVAAGFNNTQVMGIGEPAIIPTAAAVANAVANALGLRIYDLPLTPDKILDALEAAAARRT
ncbi:MAG TPA: xanthine dehydrogenase family protein molybdopterin-binding subunit [Candidatus Polarisedimenticolia bacterium]|nr:xanthine dehydrogenase family protein molybdopterin-binding subunit [Candidatus Polarisedimenticolia bacterium]